MPALPAFITQNAKYKKSRKRNKGFFWQYLYRTVKRCAKENPLIDPDVTIQRMLDMDWEVYDTPTDFLRSYDMERDLPSIYSCFTEREREADIELMAEEANKEAMHQRRIERAASELIKNYREELMELSDKGDVLASMFFEEYKAFIESYGLLKTEMRDLEEMRKKLERRRKKEVEGKAPGAGIGISKIERMLEEIREEIVKLREREREIEIEAPAEETFEEMVERYKLMPLGTLRKGLLTGSMYGKRLSEVELKGIKRAIAEITEIREAQKEIKAERRAREAMTKEITMMGETYRAGMENLDPESIRIEEVEWEDLETGKKGIFFAFDPRTMSRLSNLLHVPVNDLYEGAKGTPGYWDITTLLRWETDPALQTHYRRHTAVERAYMKEALKKIEEIRAVSGGFFVP